MKREARQKYPDVYKIWHIFSWKLCVACNKEFRRERGWVEITGYRAVLHYVCVKCCPTMQSAYETIKKYKKDSRGQRPPAPPPLPPKVRLLKDGEVRIK